MTLQRAPPGRSTLNPFACCAKAHPLNHDPSDCVMAVRLDVPTECLLAAFTCGAQHIRTVKDSAVVANCMSLQLRVLQNVRRRCSYPSQVRQPTDVTSPVLQAACGGHEDSV